MRRYVLLAYADWPSMVADTMALEAGLGAALIAGEALGGVDTATTVRVRDGEVSLTDGPFGELGAVLVVEAADLDEAIAIAGRWTAAHVGCVEVRPVSA